MPLKISQSWWWAVGVGLAGMGGSSALAQEVIYRCGHEYTNQKPVPAPGQKPPDCTVLQGVSVTEIKGLAPNPPSPPPSKGAEKGAEKNSQADSKQDPQAGLERQEARAILSAEWARAQAQHQALLAEYQNGAPPLLGAETRNHQKYLDRVAELKRQLDRNEADLNCLQHELDRIK